ncbi:UDP-N-acetylmuramoyl-L-alanine--D-glutamate ligase [Acidithrix ferrooxidans]|uniref:UDP-N-acetylmuramoylalanine--D-glutamate ligase n=1 Tax=Acidithrix ferrooxidans TaxID=1280514 RepID=A0A0D8HMQ6_9ACTN|nr:UDP-N-acetylmuramoyl-L-alanine--D-glutamate ligase [Acidithrix ferrooxidans]KJF19042.1 UDP-N-acetylmuramoylalanine--D-glutamate ligase [Acidithrix ferrooxidans]
MKPLTQENQGDSATGHSSQSILVGGYGRAGKSAVRLARQLGCNVIVFESNLAIDLPGDLSVIRDENELADLIVDVDKVIVSPGIEPTHGLFGDPSKVQSEMAFARERITSPIIAITGTNGKTTVSTLLAEMAERSGSSVRALGNIGTPLSEAVGSNLDLIVLEASSFQLANTSNLAPIQAAILNFAPDHLDWHGSIEHYLASKMRIVEGMDDDAQVWISNFSPEVSGSLDAIGRSYRQILGEGGDIFENELIVLGRSIGPISDLKRQFNHDLTNFLFAGAMAASFGCDYDAIRSTCLEFEGLAHRMQYVGSFGGYQVFDDSKATTPDAVICDMESLQDVVLIAGGKNKGLDLSVLAILAPKLRGVVAIGESASDIEGAFVGHDLSVVRAFSMADAVEGAFGMAQMGDSIVLSPGCTSWDWYSSYVERGLDFQSSIKKSARLRGLI